jgi:hypothetical protein
MIAPRYRSQFVRNRKGAIPLKVLSLRSRHCTVEERLDEQWLFWVSSLHSALLDEFNGSLHPCHVFLQTDTIPGCPPEEYSVTTYHIDVGGWTLRTASQRIQPPGLERSTARVCLRMSRLRTQRIRTASVRHLGRSEATDVRPLLLLCDIVAHAVIRSSHAPACVIHPVQHPSRNSFCPPSVVCLRNRSIGDMLVE